MQQKHHDIHEIRRCLRLATHSGQFWVVHVKIIINPWGVKMNSVKRICGQKSKELSKRAFQQVRTYGSLRFKGIVSDHGSTALAVTYIGYGFKNLTNLGLANIGPGFMTIFCHY